MLPTQTPLLGIALAWIARTFSQTLEDEAHGDVPFLSMEAKAAALKLGGKGAGGAQRLTHKTMNRIHVGTGL